MCFADSDMCVIDRYEYETVIDNPVFAEPLADSKKILVDVQNNILLDEVSRSPKVKKVNYLVR